KLQIGASPTTAFTATYPVTGKRVVFLTETRTELPHTQVLWTFTPLISAACAGAGIASIMRAASATTATVNRFTLLVPISNLPARRRSCWRFPRGSWVQDGRLKNRRNGCNRKYRSVVGGHPDNVRSFDARDYGGVIRSGLSAYSGGGITDSVVGR